jgi:hypothetical protein
MRSCIASIVVGNPVNDPPLPLPASQEGAGVVSQQNFELEVELIDAA